MSTIAAEKPPKAGRKSGPEWEARVDLAACYRLVNHYGMCDMHLNHISARVPGEPDHFLINPFGMMYEEITASCLLEIDHDGHIIENPNPQYTVNLPGFVIHSAIHRARPGIGCVLHTHTPAGMAIASLDCGLLPMTQTAMRFARVAYHDYEGVVVNIDEQKRLVDNLGDCEVMIMRNHGLLAVGETISAAFASIVRLERACQTQLMAMAAEGGSGAKIVLPSQEVIELSNRQLARAPSPDAAGKHRPQGWLEWPALRRMLDRRDPSYQS